jgi:tRNA pseudouridine38-40 synthase
MWLSYLGGAYAGWQRQRNALTVQQEVETALARLFGVPIRATAAGRTDAGVHAAGQVVHFDAPLQIPPPGVLAALNTLLPSDIRVMRVRRAPSGFDARRDARLKHYCYRLAWGGALPPWEDQRVWLLSTRPRLELMEAATGRFAGVHDFASFALSGHAGVGRRGTVRRIAAARIAVRGRRAAIHVIGDGFLRGMVRRIAGSIVDVGRGAQEISWIDDLLTDPTTRPPAPTAPPRGLTLERVTF